MQRRDFLKVAAVTATSVLVPNAFAQIVDSAKSANVPTVTLNNGIKMPIFGFGTLKLGDASETQKIVESAIAAGYRLFDTAQSYANEEAVGAAFAHAFSKDGGFKREDFFITVKLFRPFVSEDKAGPAYFESLKKLRLDYADLFLIHQPVADTYGAYRAMTKLYKEKAVRAIGVSNFNPARLMDFVQNHEITPAVNQVECHPHFQNEAALLNMKELGVQMEAFSPLKQGKDGILQDKVLSEIAQKHGKTVPQVILRWVTQRGIVAIAKATKESHIQENLAIFDFELSDDEMTQIKTLDKNAPMLNHQDPKRIKWFNERTAGQSLNR